MNQNPITDLTVIIRSAGERTERACYELLACQVPEEQIFTVSEVPFSATLRASLKLGLEQGRKWTLCVDADVLVKEGAVREMIEYAEMEQDEVVEVQGYCIDKFFFGHKAAGNHLYRTVYLNNALKHIPEEGTSLRPETDMLEALKETGLYWKQYDITIGLHDFEQYYRDIFAKKYLQSYKHEHKLSAFAREYRRFEEEDIDYRVALWGLAAGLIENGNVYADQYRVPFEHFNNFARNFGLQEKTESAILYTSVSDIIECYGKQVRTGTIKPLMKNLFNKSEYLVDTMQISQEEKLKHKRFSRLVYRVYCKGKHIFHYMCDRIIYRNRL